MKEGGITKASEEEGILLATLTTGDLERRPTYPANSRAGLYNVPLNAHARSNPTHGATQRTEQPTAATHSTDYKDNDVDASYEIQTTHTIEASHRRKKNSPLTRRSNH